MKMKNDLSQPRQQLIDVMQQTNYGRIEGLKVHDGEPVFYPFPNVVQHVMFGKKNGPNELRGSDFVLKQKVAEMFEMFDRKSTFCIQELYIENGLPVKMTIKNLVQV